VKRVGCFVVEEWVVKVGGNGFGGDVVVVVIVVGVHRVVVGVDIGSVGEGDIGDLGRRLRLTLSLRGVELERWRVETRAGSLRKKGGRQHACVCTWREKEGAGGKLTSSSVSYPSCPQQHLPSSPCHPPCSQSQVRSSRLPNGEERSRRRLPVRLDSRARGRREAERSEED
jgi:hypothetical protein